MLGCQKPDNICTKWICTNAFPIVAYFFLFRPLPSIKHMFYSQMVSRLCIQFDCAVALSLVVDKFIHFELNQLHTQLIVIVWLRAAHCCDIHICYILIRKCAYFTYEYEIGNYGRCVAHALKKKRAAESMNESTDCCRTHGHNNNLFTLCDH